MSLASNLSNLATRIGTEVKAVRTLVNGNATDLSALTTTSKTNLVAAVNEVKGIAEAAAGGGVSINDAVTNTTQTWSSSKIDSNNPTWLTIADKPAFVAEGTTAALARTAIGAGTSSLVIGTGAGDAKAGNWLPTAANISDSTATGRSVLLAVDAAAARTAIGAGTSNLAIGTTGTTAAAGNRVASETATGMVELATVAEATTGTDTTRAVTAAGLKAVADTKAALTHNHTTTNITDFQTAVDARIALTVDAAPAALDTLNELAAALGDDPNFSSTITTALGNRVRVDAAQAFTAPQMLQGRQNIDAASSTDVGDTTTNFVTTFEAALI